jgi:hypothetical protein
MSAGAAAAVSVNSMVPQPPQKVARREVQTSVTLPLNGLRFCFPRAHGGYFPVIQAQCLYTAEIAALGTLESALPKVLISLIQEYLTIQPAVTHPAQSRLWGRLNSSFERELSGPISTVDIMIVAPYFTDQPDPADNTVFTQMLYNTNDQNNKPVCVFNAQTTVALGHTIFADEEPNCAANPLPKPALAFKTRQLSCALLEYHSTRELYSYLLIPKLTEKDAWCHPNENNMSFQRTEMLRIQFVHSDNPTLTMDEALEADIRANPEAYEKLKANAFEGVGIDIYDSAATVESVVARKIARATEQAVKNGARNSVSKKSGRLMSAISAAGAPIFKAPNMAVIEESPQGQPLPSTVKAMDFEPPKRVKKSCTESLCTIL